MPYKQMEKFEQGLHCLPFWPHLLEAFSARATLSEFQGNPLDVPKFRTFTIVVICYALYYALFM